jgi:hypothetical protein
VQVQRGGGAGGIKGILGALERHLAAVEHHQLADHDRAVDHKVVFRSREIEAHG